MSTTTGVPDVAELRFGADVGSLHDGGAHPVAAAEVAAALGGRVSVEQLLTTPFALFAATPDDAADELLRHTARWGITSWCTHAPSGPAFARVVAAVRGRAA
jgi:hypothetical protein